jgi:hypothetical protein
MRRILSLGLVALACGNTSRSNDVAMGSGGGGGSAGSALAGAPSSGGASGNGSGGLPSSGGSAVAGAPSSGGAAGTGDVIDDFLASVGVVCREVRRCYPELQDDPLQCTGPVDADNTAVWVDTGAALSEPDRAELEACLRGFADQAGLRLWIQCTMAAEQEEADCIAPCPANVEACVIAGNANNDMCVDVQPADFAMLEMCFVLGP